MRLIALKPMSYATRRLLPNDEFDAPRAHAQALIAVKKAQVAARQRGDLPPPPKKVAAVIGPSAAEKAAEDEREKLRAEAEALGIVTDGRWGVARLQDEIAAAKEQPSVKEQPAPVGVDANSGAAPATSTGTDSTPPKQADS